MLVPAGSSHDLGNQIDREPKGQVVKMCPGRARDISVPILLYISVSDISRFNTWVSTFWSSGTRLGLLTPSHRRVDAARRIDGIWVFSVARSARAARAAGIESSRRRLRLLTLSHGCVDEARRIDGIWVFSVARAARAAGIESSRRRLRLLTPSHGCVDEARRIDGIWVFSVARAARAARAAGIESSRRRLRLLTPS
jgi:uncharacterized GH25 family protein